MKQILQNINDGSSEILDVPTPQVKPGTLLINTSCSVISPGTERMLQKFGQSNWLKRARQQPDNVRMVLDKVRTDGLVPTIEAVKSKLDEPIPLGYSNVGTVLEVGEGVSGFRVGDRVASNGPHAEIVRVSQNLCMRVPDAVGDEPAAFTVLGAIALQGIRLVQPTLGETVVVTGLGLVGLMTVQLLRAHGCKVIGIDYQQERLTLARQFGAEVVDLSRKDDPLTIAETNSKGRGVDAVIITAATKSNEPVSQAAKMCRKRGRIVLVGVAGLELSRTDFFEKELSFQVSCSYGPGRYDPAYEDKGQDYPVGFVRWTEQRNFEAVLDMMAGGRLDMGTLISHRFPIEKAVEAYALLGGEEPSLGILLEYPRDDKHLQATHRIALSEPRVTEKPAPGQTEPVVVGFIGAGNYAGRVLIPAFKKAGASLHTVVSSGGVSAARYGRKFGFQEATTDVQNVFQNPEINTVVIATRHDSHARYVCQALEAGKHVFVEKPLALTLEELDQVEQTWKMSGPEAEGQRLVLMVGFNRRFAPHIIKMKELLVARNEPKAFIMTVNAGAIPADHWTQDPQIGGGRIIGEACHFIDLLRFLADAPIVGHRAQFLGETTDTANIVLEFADGSIGTIHYLANGHKSVPKERLEVFCGGGVLQLDNFRSMRGFGWSDFKKSNLLRQDKGQLACVKQFVSDTKAGRQSHESNATNLKISRVAIELANS